MSPQLFGDFPTIFLKKSYNPMKYHHEDDDDEPEWLNEGDSTSDF
jgi:hypothetical protein